MASWSTARGGSTPADRASVEGMAVTSVPCTLVDLADILSERGLAQAVHESEVLRLFDLGRLVGAQSRVAGRRGSHRPP